MIPNGAIQTLTFHELISESERLVTFLFVLFLNSLLCHLLPLNVVLFIICRPDRHLSDTINHVLLTLFLKLLVLLLYHSQRLTPLPFSS